MYIVAMIMMASNPAMGHLASVLESHQLTLPQVVPTKAIDASESEMTATEWIREHLEPESLLSTDEATL